MMLRLMTGLDEMFVLVMIVIEASSVHTCS